MFPPRLKNLGRSSIVSLILLVLVAAGSLYLAHEVFDGKWLAASLGVDGKTYVVPSLPRLLAVSGLWLLSFVGTLAIVRFSANKNHEKSSSFIESTFKCGMSFAWIAMFGGVPIALYTGCTVDAGRSGAVATVLAILSGPLAIEFAKNRNYEISRLRANHPFKMDGELNISETAYGELASNLQKYHVLLAVVMGTLLWAYGDVAARVAQLFFAISPVCNF